MAIEHVGQGTFIDTERVDPPEGAPRANIYAYAFFRSLEHVEFGLTLTEGGPRAEELDVYKVGQYGMEPIATFWEVGHAIDAIEREKDVRYFEDDPFVEVTSEADYIAVLDALDVEESAWEGPGLYDFRDAPPTYAGSVEDYELEEMKDAADQAFDFMFQGEEWEDAYRDLAERG